MTSGKEREYAEALFLLTEEESLSDTVLEELSEISALLTENSDYIKLLDTPSVPKEERMSLIDEAFSGVSEYVVNLMKILAERHLAYIFPRTAKEYKALYNTSRGIEEVEAVTAAPMDKEQIEKLKSALEKKTAKTVIIKNTVDGSVLGGMKLRYMGKQLDGTIRSRLDAFERSLKNTVI